MPATGDPDPRQSVAPAGATDARNESRAPTRGFLPRVRRAGAGGRWLLWGGRAVLWALIVVVVFNGIRVPLVRALEPAEPEAAANRTEVAFPRSAASAYALQFARTYLTYGQGRPEERSARLAAYLPEGADPQLGWNGEGALRLQTAQVAGVDVRDAQRGVVTLSVRASDRWMRLAVPVYADRGAMAISGQPALFPRPPEAQLPSAPAPPVDEQAADELRRQLPGFFQAYAGSGTESLERYLAPGTTMTGFSGAVRFQSLDDVVVPAAGGGDRTREATATVTWKLPAGGNTGAGQLQQTYQLTVREEDGRWYVEEIRGDPKAGFP